MLTKRVAQYGPQLIESGYREKEAITARNSCCKRIYGNLFTWIVKKINDSIQEKIYGKDGATVELEELDVESIGLLDIFGFESFTANSFEQLCINYANEKLQQHFNTNMIALEMKEYSIELSSEVLSQIELPADSRVLELFESTTPSCPSMFSLVDDAGKARSDDESLLRQYHQFYSNNPCYAKASAFETPQFKISHYAGEVIYDIKGFVEKNQD